MRNRRGFTLIELLVVIAIISLLVSILLPSLSRAKELAKNVVCTMQVRNLHMPWAMYTEDNDGHHVRMFTPLLGGSSGYWLHKLLGAGGSGGVVTWGKENAYLSSPETLLCPNGSHNANISWWGLTPPSMPDKGGEAQCSYGYYGVQLWEIIQTEFGTALKCPDVPLFYSRRLVRPDVWPVFVDAAQPIIQDSMSVKLPEQPPYQYFTAYARHMGFANLMFADGHAGNVEAGSPEYNNFSLQAGASGGAYQ